MALWLLCCGLPWVFVGGCDEEESPPKVEEVVLFPLSFNAETRGIAVFPGDEGIVALTEWSKLAAGAQWLVIRAQLVDELLISREGEAGLASARFAARVAHLRQNVTAVQTFSKLVLVLDLLRVSDGSRPQAPTPYLTTWDKNERDPDRYGFWRSDYRAAVLEQVRLAVRAEKPAVFVFGAEMERYLTMPGGLEDYTNFVTLYREVYAVVKEVSPETQVGVGVNWVRLMLDVLPREMLLPHEVGDGVRFPADVEMLSCAALPAEDMAALQAVCVEKVMARYLLPLLRYPVGNGEEMRYERSADVLALAVHAGGTDFGNVPSACPADFFAPLIPWSEETPLLLYSVNWQTPTAVGFDKQAQWFTAVMERLVGAQVKLLTWAGTKDLVTSDCTKLTRDLGAPDGICYQGLLSASTAPKELYHLFFTDRHIDAP